MNSAFDPQALREEYQQLDSGEPKMRAIRAAITQAETAKDNRILMIFHRDLIFESVFSGDRYQALIDFPQYYAIYEQNEDIQVEFRFKVLWTFKWILQATTEFPQISKKQVMEWFALYRKELLSAGYSLRAFYDFRAVFYSYYDRAKTRMDYHSFMEAPIDEMTNGKRDEYDTQIQWELYFGNREKAEIAMKKLMAMKFRDDEIPRKPYLDFLEDDLRRRNVESAAEYAKKLLPLSDGDRFCMEQLGMLLCYFAWQDPMKGWHFLNKNMSVRLSSRNPYLCFWFDRGAMLLCRVLSRGSETLTDHNGKECTPADLAERAAQLRESCAEIGAQFDARNESDYYANALTEYDSLIEINE